MLRLLLDEHISPAVARAAAQRCRGMDVLPVSAWQNGRWLNAPDDVLLHGAREHGLTLVTYDLRTIPVLLRSWADQGLDHGGVVFVDERTIPQNDIGGLMLLLCELWRAERMADWRNRVVFLRAARRGGS